MISRLDRDIGRLMDRLRRHGLDGHTLVIFTSDNGPHKEGGADPGFFHSSGPLRGIKRDLHEGGIRVPTIARWPGHVPVGRVSTQPWAFWDLLPTAAELAGVTPPQGLDGISVLPTLLGQPQTRQATFLYWEFHERGFQQAARMGNWKAVRKAVGGPLELYDLSEDTGETTDLAARQPAIVAGFEAKFATCRTDSPHWPIRPARGRP
jgi:arylsulfatase A-like enzyme